ncbi:MAG: DUF3253 domain-containing protein [Rhodobacteraceae bacterium]|nr:MAG: DUF3253 domain-containing protein [Paracoccaceae bacterium]
MTAREQRNDEAAARTAILDLLARRRTGGSICPSEAARALGPDWRAAMPMVRRAAGALAAEGRIVVTQRGAVVDIADARGPVRLAPPR